MRAHPHDACPCPAPQLHPPPAQRDAHTRPRGYRFGPMGHEEVGLVRPVVAPPRAEDHRDVSQMAPPRPCGVNPQGATRWGVDRRNPPLGRLPARQVGHQRFERLPIGKVPGARQRQDVPLAHLLSQRQVGRRSLGSIDRDDDLLTPGGPVALVEPLPTQRLCGRGVRVIRPPEHGDISRDTLDLPWRQEQDDPDAKDRGMGLAQTGVLGYRMRLAACALPGAVAHQRQEAVLGGAQGRPCLVGEPPEPGRRTPLGRPPQAAVMLVGQGRRPLSSPRVQRGLFTIADVAHEEPAEDPLVPVATARAQPPQALRHLGRQTGQRQGPGLLEERRAEGHSRSSIPGSAWTVKDFHARP
jgi:hypothetical protein